MAFKAPYMRTGDAERFAEAFLDEQYPQRLLPIPIDLLAERAFHLDIVPCHGIDVEVEGHGFLTSDLTTIYVDWDVYHHKIPHRYRSTVAHELGHRVMHAALYEELHFESLDEYIRFTRQADEQEIYWFEKHADWFMGFVLVPRRELRRLFDERLHACAAAGLPADPPNPAVADRVVRSLAQDFRVSPGMIRTRLRQDALLDAELLD